ncbi:MAG: hypothetical protein HeimC3_12440 [Candidatus Heimdallarchaeota archaeon LC_3]|nr:MAG: hypothetical protein HeimC3_12440 [Candidatus Heimdallarchaeota archaeon LC_3]
MITKNRWLKTFSDSEEKLNEWMNKALKNENSLLMEENIYQNQYVKKIDYKIPDYQIFQIEEKYVVITFVFEENSFKNSFLSLKTDQNYPLQPKGVAIEEEGLTATVEFSGPQNLKLFSFANDFFNNKDIYQNFNKQNRFYLTGWALSLEQQLDPPEVNRPDGIKVTTAGSTILLPHQTPQPDEYVYQLQVQDIEEFLFQDFINVIKIRTRLAVMPEGDIPLDLYVTERSLQSNYYPEKHQDIMGVFILCCSAN